MADKRTVYVGGLAEEVTEKLLNDAFIPFGDLVDIQMPTDYEYVPQLDCLLTTVPLVLCSCLLAPCQLVLSTLTDSSPLSGPRSTVDSPLSNSRVPRMQLQLLTT